MVHLGKITLGDVPRVALALREGVDRAEADAALADGADVIELRIDAFPDTSEAAVRAELARFEGLPVLATIRHAAEGGEWRASEDARAALFEAVLPLADAIDIELSAQSIRSQVIAAARNAGKLVIGSYHNFQATPSIEALERVLLDGKEAGVDVVKIAAHCATSGDLRCLARFLALHPETPLIVIGMGPLGMASRVLFPALGSLLTYTFLGAPTAPGQLNCERTVQYLNAFYPDRTRTQ